MRGRKPDIKRTKEAVIQTLKNNPNGLTLRELGRQTGIPKSTLSYHLTNYLQNNVDELVIAPKERVFLRLIRLKGE